MRLRYRFIYIISFLIIITTEILVYLSFNNLEIIKNIYIEKILLLLGIILPSIFIISTSYSKKHFSIINSYFYRIGALWLGIIFYTFALSFIIAILVTLNQYYVLNLPIKNIALILLFLILIFITYGIFNANNPRITRWEIKSKDLAPLWKDKKIIFISDLHLGDIHREKFLNKVIDIINSEKPDITFNLGDIIDGPSIPYKKVFAPFDRLNPPLGNYYVEGNHETYSNEYALFKENFPNNLNDTTGKKVIINNTQIIGIPYFKTKSKEKTINILESVEYNKTMPSIILMHNPKNTSILTKNNVSLVLSGHTHNGQIFPTNFLVKILYGKYTYGTAKTLDKTSITSSGVGVALLPLRIGTIPEIVVLNII